MRESSQSSSRTFSVEGQTRPIVTRFLCGERALPKFRCLPRKMQGHAIEKRFPSDLTLSLTINSYETRTCSERRRESCMMHHTYKFQVVSSRLGTVRFFVLLVGSWFSPTYLVLALDSGRFGIDTTNIEFLLGKDTGIDAVPPFTFSC